ncbi:MAG: zinc ribbon domain-containing protein [Desulfovibrio sp.]|nr:zinc ribbon domain-containing protein [Desulfovibrio sp.]
MPLYDFCCENCGKEFEDIVKNESSINPSCPSCGSNKTTRKVSAPSPLKTGAFPFKPGPVRPLGNGGPSCGGSCGTGSCPMSDTAD